MQDERTASAGGRTMDKRLINLKPDKGEKVVFARSEMVRKRTASVLSVPSLGTIFFFFPDGPKY